MVGTESSRQCVHNTEWLLNRGDETDVTAATQALHTALAFLAQIGAVKEVRLLNPYTN